MATIYKKGENKPKKKNKESVIAFLIKYLEKIGRGEIEPLL